MKIGDKVRFLHTTGGGVVKKFQGKDLVIVEDESGFDVPLLIKECIVVGELQKEQVRTSNQAQTQVREIAEEKIPEEVYEYEETKEGEQISIHLAYLSNDIKQLSTTSFEAYLINESNFFLSYNYLSRVDNGWILRSGGVVEPNTKIFIEEFEASDVNKLEYVCLQCIAYKKDKPFQLKQAVTKELKIDTTKFFKVHCFRENDFFDEKVILYSLMVNDAKCEELLLTGEELKTALKTKNEKTPARLLKTTLSKRDTDKPLEVDLHIHNLLETTVGMSNSDILAYQLQVFNRTIAENKNKKGQKIVFIHGKGEGVLRNTLIDELKRKYKHLFYQDASFREYGFGATLVMIK